MILLGLPTIHSR